MYMARNSLFPAAEAAEKLVERYQVRLRSVEQLGERTVRAWLNDGRQVTAMVVAGGTVAMWEQEEVC